MLIFSHRGYHVEVPENTHEAFAAAIDRGVDGIETDLRLTADGKIVLFHDRHTPDGRPISGQSHAEICRAVGYDAPLLEETLERWPEPCWMLEVKTPEVVEPLLPILRRHLPLRRLQVTSFWHSVVAAVRDQVEMETGVLVAHRPLCMTAGACGWLPDPERIGMIVWYYETADPACLTHAREQGFRNFVYGANDAADLARCRDIGLDGAITDAPPVRRAWC